MTYKIGDIVTLNQKAKRYYYTKPGMVGNIVEVGSSLFSINFPRLGMVFHLDPDCIVGNVFLKSKEKRIANKCKILWNCSNYARKHPEARY